jgi:hypothetical protein
MSSLAFYACFDIKNYLFLSACIIICIFVRHLQTALLQELNAKEEKTPESMSLIFGHTRFIISSGVYERPFCTAALCATMRHTHVEAVHLKGY